MEAASWDECVRARGDELRRERVLTFAAAAPRLRRYFPSITHCFENQNKLGLRRVDLGVGELTNRFGGGYWDDADEKVGAFSALFSRAQPARARRRP